MYKPLAILPKTKELDIIIMISFMVSVISFRILFTYGFKIQENEFKESFIEYFDTIKQFIIIKLVKCFKNR